MALVFWDTLRLGADGRHWSARGRLRYYWSAHGAKHRSFREFALPSSRESNPVNQSEPLTLTFDLLAKLVLR